METDNGPLAAAADRCLCEPTDNPSPSERFSSVVSPPKGACLERVTQRLKDSDVRSHKKEVCVGGV